jgi:hypothetical protein
VVWQLHVHDEVFGAVVLCGWEFCCGVVVSGVVLIRDSGGNGSLLTGAGDSVFVDSFSRSPSMIGSVCVLYLCFCGDATSSSSPTLDPKAVHCDP